MQILPIAAAFWTSVKSTVSRKSGFIPCSHFVTGEVLHCGKQGNATPKEHTRTFKAAAIVRRPLRTSDTRYMLSTLEVVKVGIAVVSVRQGWLAPTSTHRKVSCMFSAWQSAWPLFTGTSCTQSGDGIEGSTYRPWATCNLSHLRSHGTRERDGRARGRKLR